MKTAFKVFVVFMVATSIRCSDSTSPNDQGIVFTDDVIQEFENTIDEAMENTNAPGIVVGVFADNGESWVATRGVSNIETDEPMNENCHFRIGSCTKTFVASVVLQLVDEGLINLDTPISTYLPELNVPSGDIITVRMLGNMTSGLIDYSQSDEFTAAAVSGEMIFTPEQLVYLSGLYPLNFEPGTDFEYCNTNYVLLGMIIQKLTGKKVKENLKERIFNQLGLENTSWPISRFLPSPYTHGYARSLIDGLLHDYTYCQPSWLDAAGILISDLTDMKKYVKVLVEGELISSRSQTEREKYTTIVETRFGTVKYGFGISEYWGWVGHTGETPGYNTAMFHHPAKGISIVVFANYQIDGSDNPAENLFFQISQIFE